MTAMTRIRRLFWIATASAVLAGGLALPASAGPGEERQRFIITVADEYDSRSVAADHRRSGAAIDYVYTAALNGFAGAMSQADLGALQRDRRVIRIERDGIATASATQDPATWGLDRIDARAGLDGKYTYTPTGAGVNAYIIDTGIRLGHSEFGNRAVSGYDAVDGGTADDCNGHGTHVAGTVGGTTYGVAKSARLVAVRVLDCGGSGTWSGVIAGMDWVTANRIKPAVANMSLGGGASTSVDAAVRGMIGAGVSTVVAAGNGNRGGKEQDACGYSPARVLEAVTIGATTQSDTKTSWSNYGDCVDLFAPGYQITSAWHTGDTATNTISGTSMAAPHVAGVAALYLQNNTDATAQQVRDAIYEASTKESVSSSKTTNNHLLYSLVTSGTSVEAGVLTGTVKAASTGEPIPGAAVTVAGATRTTDMDGAYSLTLPPNDYTASAAATGYTSQSFDVTVSSGQTTSQDFLLSTPGSGTETSSMVLVLSADPKVRGTTPVTSAWTDVDGHNYTVFVNGAPHKTGVTEKTETTSWKGGGTLVYQVCRTGTTACSNQESITI